MEMGKSITNIGCTIAGVYLISSGLGNTDVCIISGNVNYVYIFFGIGFILTSAYNSIFNTII